MASKSRTRATTSALGPTRLVIGAALLVAWVLSGCVSGDLPEVPADDQGLVRGQMIYSNSCANCHGNSGAGGTGNRLNNGIVLDRYPDPATQRAFIVEGRNRMPGFGASLTDEQIDDVVRYTREIIALQ